MFPPDENLDETDPLEQQTDTDPEPKKRNSGRTGPTSAEGRATSAQNARKHGACARTLILPMESEQGWLILLSRWQDTYKPLEASLEADFVLRTAQAEWFRLRTQRQYDEFITTTAGQPPYMWTSAQCKMHDLMLRYKNSAERSFQREYRLLEAHYKSHKLTPPPRVPDPEPIPEFIVELAPIEEILQQIRAGRPAPLDPLFSPPPT
jgi:hypothetical protein